MRNDRASGRRGEAPHEPMVAGPARRGLVVAFVAILVVAAAAEVLVHHHEHFGIEATFGFHAWYGLLGGVAAILGAAALGGALRRRDGYREG